MKTHFSISSAVLFCIAIASTVAPLNARAAVAYTFYASPTGSGSTCSQDSPCSLTNVAAAVRAVNASMTGDIYVQLRGGKYYLSSSLTLTESDSGFNGHTVYWQNYPGETPEIIGGTPVTGWTLYSGSIYQAYVGPGLGFNALYENGARASKARYPQTGYLTDINGSGGKGEANYLQAWLVGAGDLPNWTDMVGGEVYVWGYWNWFSSTLPITDFNHDSQTVTLLRPPFWGLINNGTSPPPCTPTTPPGALCKTQNTHDRYFIQNVMSALTAYGAAGEFYYNGGTGYLYYIPRTSPIGSQEIILPQLKNIIELKGSSPSNQIQNVQIQRIKVWGSDFTHSFDSWADPHNWIEGGAGGTASEYENNEPIANRFGNIYVMNASNVTLQSLEISAAGYNGVEMDQYCQSITVENSRIHDVGYNAVAINGGLKNTTDALISQYNLIQKNRIYNIGQLVGHGAGVHIEQSAYNNVIHNEIHDGPRYGVNIVGASDNTPAVNLARHNTISFNEAYNLNTDSWDSGNYYQFAAGINNTFDRNMSHDSHALYTNVNYYMDGNAASAVVSNNIGYNPAANLDTVVNSTNTWTNNVLSSDPAAWAAAGLDSSQMGIPRTDAAVLSLLLN